MNKTGKLKKCLISHSLICVFALLSAAEASQLDIIPNPVSYKKVAGEFLLTAETGVYAPANAIETYLKQLNEATSQVLKSVASAKDAGISFLNADLLAGSAGMKLSDLGEEAYVIKITPNTVHIYAHNSRGHFYGLQTLVQLIHGAEKKNGGLSISCAVIEDFPRFEWRGFMLDESRHFSGEEAVKRYLDTMAYYKLNQFHWHLTDSHGWRVEIKKYPKLTTVGAIGNKTDPNAPAKFYTQEQIKNIVAYAKERHIRVIPEIDMPGHANAAVRAYPQFSGGDSGKHGEFTFHPLDDATDTFLRDILEEVAGLFPDADIIHYGGDEVHFGWGEWPTLPAVKELMEKEDLKLRDIEKRFNRRFAKVINDLGFKTGGWDELMGSDLPTDKTVLFWWRHDRVKDLHESLEKAYDVVLCPRIPCYLDYNQHESHKHGMGWYAIVSMDKTYAFPDTLKLPEEFEGKVLGIQACLWTEHTVTQERRDYMAFPRLIALAESAWTPREQKDFGHFKQRLRKHLPQLKERGIGYYDSFVNSPEPKR